MATQRRLPKVSELMEFVPGVPSLPTNRNAVARAGDLADLRRIAKRRAPAMVFDYVDGAAEQERSADRAREAFDRVTFRPRVLRNVGQIDPSAEDGTQVAAGVLLQACDATLIDRDDGLVVARHAVVAHHALAWPDAITTAEQLTAIAQLKALGVLVRQGA